MPSVTDISTTTNTTTTNTNAITFIDGEPPIRNYRGRARNPIYTRIYNELASHLDIWAKVNSPILTAKEKNSLSNALRKRCYKDGFKLNIISTLNDTTNSYDVWVKITRS